MKNLLIKLLIALSVIGMSVAEEENKEVKAEEELQSIVLGGGCFWCVEAVFAKLDGVRAAESGYMGGHQLNPTYEQVCSGRSGHIEVVKVTYNPRIISTIDILNWFWKAHDPTTKDRQGNDKGPQYASAIFYENEAQKVISETSIQFAQNDFENPIVTYVRPVEKFYPAESYHQDYYALNKKTDSYCRFVITPKMKKLKLAD